MAGASSLGKTADLAHPLIASLIAEKAEIPNIAIPSGIRFFRKAVSVMYNIFAFSSTLKITSGAKINKDTTKNDLAIGANNRGLYIFTV